MAVVRQQTTIYDSLSFTLNEADLTGKTQQEYIYTMKRDVPGSDGLQWWIQLYPAGDRETAQGYVSVYLWVNKSVTAKYSLALSENYISPSTSYHYPDPSQGYGWSNFASHEELRHLFHDGILTIACSVEFDVKIPYILCHPRNFQLFDHVVSDAEFVVGIERVPFHKHFFSMISPVFNAMFLHDTAESKSGQVEVVDFDYVTVNAAVDFCYGRDLKDLSVDLIVAVLRFADKYLITAVTNQFEKLPSVNLSIESFCTIVHYAYDCNKKTLLAECSKFFKDHQAEIKETEKFTELPLALAIDVIRAAFDLETDLDVLRHAYKTGITFVVDYLERPLRTKLTVENFCTVVDYAWECSRDDLKNQCATFYNDNTLAISNLKDFHKLPALREVLQISYTLKHGAN